MRSSVYLWQELKADRKKRGGGGEKRERWMRSNRCIISTTCNWFHTRLLFHPPHPTPSSFKSIKQFRKRRTAVIHSQRESFSLVMQVTSVCVRGAHIPAMGCGEREKCVSQKQDWQSACCRYLSPGLVPDHSRAGYHARARTRAGQDAGRANEREAQPPSVGL